MPVTKTTRSTTSAAKAKKVATTESLSETQKPAAKKTPAKKAPAKKTTTAKSVKTPTVKPL